jgi:hypothetical protein
MCVVNWDSHVEVSKRWFNIGLASFLVKYSSRYMYLSGCFIRGWRVLWSRLFNTVYKDKRCQDIKEKDAEKRNDFKERVTEDLKR